METSFEIFRDTLKSSDAAPDLGGGNWNFFNEQANKVARTEAAMSMRNLLGTVISTTAARSGMIQDCPEK